MSDFIWGEVTSTDPLRVQIDGDDAPLPITLDSLVDPRSLVVGLRVRVERGAGLWIVHGQAGGFPELFGVLSLGCRNLFANARGRINQRGSVSGASLASGAYFLDRWKSTAASNAVTWTGSDATGRTITVPSSKSIAQDVEQGDVIPGDYLLINFGTAQGRVYNVGSSAPAYATADEASPLVVTLDGAANVRVEFDAGTVKNPVLIRADAWVGFFPDISYAADVAWCQRFYERGWVASWASNGGSIRFSQQFRVVKRAAPTVTLGAPVYGTSLIPASVLATDANGFLVQDRSAESNYSWSASAEL